MLLTTEGRYGGAKIEFFCRAYNTYDFNVEHHNPNEVTKDNGGI